MPGAGAPAGSGAAGASLGPGTWLHPRKGHQGSPFPLLPLPIQPRLFTLRKLTHLILLETELWLIKLDVLLGDKELRLMVSNDFHSLSTHCLPLS